MSKFEKGTSGNPHGRPKGATDRKWASLEYWFTSLMADLDNDKMPLIERAKIKTKLVEIILAKKSLPPDTPEESLENVEKLFNEAKKNVHAAASTPRPSARLEEGRPSPTQETDSDSPRDGMEGL